MDRPNNGSLRLLPFSLKPNQTHYSPSTNINEKATSHDILLVIQTPKILRLKLHPKTSSTWERRGLYRFDGGEMVPLIMGEALSLGFVPS